MRVSQSTLECSCDGSLFPLRLVENACLILKGLLLFHITHMQYFCDLGDKKNSFEILLALITHTHHSLQNLYPFPCVTSFTALNFVDAFCPAMIKCWGFVLIAKRNCRLLLYLGLSIPVATDLCVADMLDDVCVPFRGWV